FKQDDRWVLCEAPDMADDCACCLDGASSFDKDNKCGCICHKRIKLLTKELQTLFESRMRGFANKVRLKPDDKLDNSVMTSLIIMVNTRINKTLEEELKGDTDGK